MIRARNKRSSKSSVLTSQVSISATSCRLSQLDTASCIRSNSSILHSLLLSTQLGCPYTPPTTRPYHPSHATSPRAMVISVRVDLSSSGWTPVGSRSNNARSERLPARNGAYYKLVKARISAVKRIHSHGVLHAHRLAGKYRVAGLRPTRRCRVDSHERIQWSDWGIGARRHNNAPRLQRADGVQPGQLVGVDLGQVPLPAVVDKARLRDNNYAKTAQPVDKVGRALGAVLYAVPEQWTPPLEATLPIASTAASTASISTAWIATWKPLRWASPTIL